MISAFDFIDSVIGKPWVNRAEGPDSYDCWGLVIDYYRRVKGVNIPTVTNYGNGQCDVCDGLHDQASKGNWVEIGSIEQDCVFIVDRDGIPSHVGIIVDSRCLHSPGSIGNPCTVGYHSLQAVEKAFGSVKFWRYVNV